MMKEPGVAVFCLDRIVDLFFIVDIVLNFMLSYRSSVTGGMVLLCAADVLLCNNLEKTAAGGSQVSLSCSNDF